MKLCEKITNLQDNTKQRDFGRFWLDGEATTASWMAEVKGIVIVGYLNSVFIYIECEVIQK